nr:MAG: hypothetical protein [Bacteriophage sp.]
MSVYDRINDTLVERYGVRFSEEGEQKSRKFFAGLCLKLGGILYNRSLFSSFVEKV